MTRDVDGHGAPALRDPTPDLGDEARLGEFTPREREILGLVVIFAYETGVNQPASSPAPPSLP